MTRALLLHSASALALLIPSSVAFSQAAEPFPLGRATSSQAALIAEDPTLRGRIQQATESALAVPRTEQGRQQYRQTMEEAGERVRQASETISERNRLQDITAAGWTVTGQWLDFALRGAPVGSSIATVANLATGRVIEGQNEETRLRAATVVYSAVNRSRDQFIAESNRIVTEVADPATRRDRLSALVREQAGAATEFFNEPGLAGIDPNLRDVMIAQGTRALVEIIIQQNGLQGSQLDAIGGKLSEGVEHARQTRDAANGVRQEVAAVSAHLTAAGQHIREMQTSLQRLIEQQTEGDANDRRNGEAISFILEATMGNLSLQRQIDALEDGHPAGMPEEMRRQLLERARETRKAEERVEGARRFGQHVETASRLAAAMSRLASLTGADEDVVNALSNLQRNLHIGQTLIGTYATASVAFATGGVFAGAMAVFGGLEGLFPGAGPDETSQQMMAEMRSLFDRVFRELQEINAKLDVLIEGQRAIMEQLQALGRQLQATEERLVWETRRVYSLVTELKRIELENAGGLADLWGACRQFRTDSLHGGIFDPSSGAVRFQTLEERARHFDSFRSDDFDECRKFIRSVTRATDLLMDGQAMVPHVALFATTWARVEPEQAPIELSAEFFQTVLHTTHRLLGARMSAGADTSCSNLVLGALGRGLTSFRQLSMNRPCDGATALTQAPAGRLALHRAHTERLYPTSVAEVARTITFMEQFFALRADDSLSRLLRGDEIVRRLERGEALAPPADFILRARRNHLRNVEIAIAQEGLLSGVIVADVLRDILLPNFDPGAAVDPRIRVAPLGTEYWTRNDTRRAFLDGEEAVTLARNTLAAQERDLARRVRESPRNDDAIAAAQTAVNVARAELQQAIQRRAEARRLPDNWQSNPAANEDVRMLNLIAAGRFDRAAVDPLRHPASQRCRVAFRLAPLGQDVASIAVAPEQDFWNRIRENHAVPLAGCLLSLNPHWASNFVRRVVLEVLRERRITPEAYAAAHDSRADVLMRRFLRGLPIEREPLVAGRPELGGGWVMLIRDEHGAVMRIRLPSPPEVVTQAIDVPPAMATLLAVKAQLLDSEIADAEGLAADGPELRRAIVWEAAMRRNARRSLRQ